MIGAAVLDVATYEEVEADTTATGQALAVVVLSSIAAGIGSFRWLGVSGLFSATAAALVAWLIWAALTYFIGTRLLPEPQTRSDLGELLRTIGFSASPGILKVFGFLPWIGWLVPLIASCWMLVAMVIAVRQALDYRSTVRALGVCLIGFFVNLAIGVLSGGRVGVAGW